ncbi:uncharacterized mitochondrial protein AtMg00820-like [Gossypium hirsutum]|uniref:Uncharacterized mitochondrial protein AtMg00820-like n=1 Tax=Gossypium hirsutum TaxID=3635 RepID=A0A1U8HNC4_GOSHI|nr:uncharacterized mitochondrial protein AtMg00820-like [Gossypium hirsutum]
MVTSSGFSRNSLVDAFSSIVAPASSLDNPHEPQSNEQTMNIHPMITRGKAGIHKPKLYLTTLQVQETIDIQATLADPNLREVVLAEHDALLTNNTWNLVEMPPKCKLIGCKWLFTVKKNPDETMAKLKTRLVGIGISQILGHDYHDPYNPIVKFSTVNVFLSLATNYG